MGFMDSVTAWFKREASDLKESTDNLERRVDSDLSRRERQLNETPAEAMERLQGEIDDESSLDEVRNKIAHKSGHADAVSELAEDDEETDPHDLDDGH